MLAAGLLLLVAGCNVPPRRGGGELRHLREPETNRGYYLYLPKPYVENDGRRPDGSKWPLVVTFHGMIPYDNAKWQSYEWALEADRYGYVVLAPELKAPVTPPFQPFPLRSETRTFVRDGEVTLKIMDHIAEQYPIDRGRVLATSWSSGGYLAHYVFSKYPDAFSALAVRLSNFSPEVMDEGWAERAKHKPILRVNTHNDVGICKSESKQAVKWYHDHGYDNVAWLYVRGKGHERTPDMAAEFFAQAIGIRPSEPSPALLKRQALDGNSRGIAFLTDKVPFPQQDQRSAATVRAKSEPESKRESDRAPAVSGLTADRGDDGSGSSLRSARGDLRRETSVSRRSTARTERGQDIDRTRVRIRLSSAVGIEPLHLGFSAECPIDWRRSADFEWLLNGEPIAEGLNGQRTLAEPGNYTLVVRVTPPGGKTVAAMRKIRVLPKLRASR